MVLYVQFKECKNTDRGVLYFVKLQTFPWMFFTFFYIVQTESNQAKHHICRCFMNTHLFWYLAWSSFSNFLHQELNAAEEYGELCFYKLRRGKKKIFSYWCAGEKRSGFAYPGRKPHNSFLGFSSQLCFQCL